MQLNYTKIIPTASASLFSRSGKNPSLSFHQIPSYKRKEIRQDWLRHIKSGQNENYVPSDSTLYI